jgi:Fe2+ transport system protein FeoA
LILPAATDLGLTVGSEITALPRSDNGQTWNLANAQGEAIAINHQQADAIIVRLVPQTAGS